MITITKQLVCASFFDRDYYYIMQTNNHGYVVLSSHFSVGALLAFFFLLFFLFSSCFIVNSAVQLSLYEHFLITSVIDHSANC